MSTRAKTVAALAALSIASVGIVAATSAMAVNTTAADPGAKAVTKVRVVEGDALLFRGGENEWGEVWGPRYQGTGERTARIDCQYRTGSGPERSRWYHLNGQDHVGAGAVYISDSKVSPKPNLPTCANHP
ncbi:MULTISPECIES: hypothetical protein [unclassified Streptomyces]|uniref:hypothetical protein n=1 Tax=unclassified Streptomyces TaxID=2593676 RepID=UPI00363221F1